MCKNGKERKGKKRRGEAKERKGNIMCEKGKKKRNIMCTNGKKKKTRQRIIHNRKKHPHGKNARAMTKSTLGNIASYQKKQRSIYQSYNN